MISVGFNARHLAYPEIRGLTRYTVELLKALSQLDSVRLVLFTDLTLQPAHVERIDAEVVIFRAPMQLFWEHVALPKKIKELGIDIFHAPADRGLPLIKVCPQVVTVHDSYERDHWRSLFHGVKRKFRYLLHEGINFFLADTVITVSEWTRKEFISLKVAPEKKLIRIYNGVGSQFNQLVTVDDKRVIANRGVSCPFILYVGGYDVRKNVEYLINSFDQTGLSDHQLIIIASKPAKFYDKLSVWKRLSCFGQIRFLEVPDWELPCFYRSAQFFVNPSLWESFSLQLLEAMACGLPIISSNRKALPEILGDAGIYFNPDGGSVLPGLMRMMSEDAGLRRKLRKRGLRRARDFSWKRTAQETLSMYRQITGQNLKKNQI